MSAAVDVEERAKEIGAVAYVVKPFELNEILTLFKLHEI
jgi:DNA-binding response OmpR family regulator